MLTRTKQIMSHVVATAVLAAVFAPLAAQAGSSMSIAPFLNKINQHILNPVIALLTAVAILVFFWGLFQFISHPDGNKEREDGKRNIMYGLFGLFIMVGVYGLIRLILGTFGIGPNSGTNYIGL